MKNDKMIVTVSAEYAIVNDNGNKEVIAYSLANGEADIKDCATYHQQIGNKAFDVLRMAMDSENISDTIFHKLNKIVKEENESNNNKVDRGDTPAEPVLIKDEKSKTVNTFAGTVKVKKVKKPMIHLLVTEDMPNGRPSREFLSITSITADNISKLKDVEEARNIDARRFKHLASIDYSFFSGLAMRCVSFKNKIFKTKGDLLTHMCKPNSEIFVSLDAIEVLKLKSVDSRQFNTSENLLTYAEIVNKYLGLEHEEEQIPFSPSSERTKMAKALETNELEHMNALMAQVGKPRFRGHYTYPPEMMKPFGFGRFDQVINMIDLNEKYLNLFQPIDRFQFEFKNNLKDLNYTTRNLLNMSVSVSNTETELQEDLNILINRVNFITTREILNLQQNKETASIEKIKSLITEVDEMVASLDREVFYLCISGHRSLIDKALKDINRKNWYFGLNSNKTRYLNVKGTSFPKNVLLSKDLKNAILNHIENSKCIHYTTMYYGLSELSNTDTLCSLTKDIDIFMKQDDIDAFMKMIKIDAVKEGEKVLKDANARVDSINIEESLSKLTENQDEALGFYGAFAKAFKEATSSDTLLSKIVNNPRWKDMERSAGIKSSIMKIDRRNTTSLCNAEIEFLTNVNIVCINTEFPDFEKVPEDKINKLLSVISLSNEGLNHHEKSQIASAVLSSGVYMSNEDLKLFLDRDECKCCTNKDHNDTAACTTLEVKDYSLDTLKRLTKSLKSFPESKHLIIFAIDKETNDLVISDTVYGMPAELTFYKVTKRKDSLFQYLDLGDIVLEDLLHAHIYLTQSFVATICDKLNIGVKAFQRRIFNYEVGRRYGIDQIIQKHDFDGDRIKCGICLPRDPSLRPTPISDTTTLPDNSLSGWDTTIFLRNPSFSYYYSSQRIERFQTEFIKFIQEEYISYVKHCLVSNLEIDNDLYVYKYTSNVCHLEQTLYVLLNMQVANAISERTSSTNIKLEPIHVVEGRIIIPRPNMISTLLSNNFVFLSLDRNNISSNIGLRTKLKILLSDFNKKFKDKLGNKGYLENSISGFNDTAAEETSNNHKEDLLNLTYPISSTIREYKKSEVGFIETVKKIEKEHDPKGIFDDYGIYYYKSESLASRDNDVYVMLRKSVAAELSILQIMHPLLKQDTNTSSIQQIPHSLFRRGDLVLIPNNARQILNQVGGVVFLEKDVADRGRTPKVSLKELNKMPDAKVKNITVVAENTVSSETGEPIDLEIIITLESKRKMKAVELRSETKKENMSLYVNLMAHLTGAGIMLESDMIIVPTDAKSLELIPYNKNNRFNTESFGEVNKINKIQSTHSEFINIPNLILESKCNIFISSYSLVAIQAHFDLKRSEVNDYIFDIGYVKPNETNHISEKVEIKREDIKPDIQLRTLAAWEVKALPKEVKDMIFNINSFSEHEEMTIKDFNQYATNHAGLCKVSFKGYSDLHIVISKEAYNRIPTAYKKFITKVDSLKAFELDAEGVKQISYYLERNQLPKIVAVQAVSSMLKMKEVNIDSDKLNPEFLDFIHTVSRVAENVKVVALTDAEDYITNNIVLYESKLAKDLYIALDVNVYKALAKNLKSKLQYKTNCFGVDADVIQRVRDAYMSGKAAMPIPLEIFATLN